MFSKITQIIPAPKGLFCSYVEKESEVEVPIAALALLENGDVITLDVCADGIVDDPTTASNFSRLYWK